MLPYAFEIHTYGVRPENSPTPPRSWVVPSPVASQLKPMRGLTRKLLLGSWLVRRPPKSSPLAAKALSKRLANRTLSPGSLGSVVQSSRMPPVRLKLPNATLSCAYSE